MFNSLKLNTRFAAAAFGALAIGAIAFSAPATAAPLPLFPFFLPADRNRAAAGAGCAPG